MDILNRLCEYNNSSPKSSLVSSFIGFLDKADNPYTRENIAGHITGSCWIVSRDLKSVLLTHHKKLNIWIPTGGHCEGEKDPFITALREGEEETGIKLIFLNKKIFSLDIHIIPIYKNIPEHNHYDFTYLFRPKSNFKYTISDESHDLKWISLDNLEDYTREENVLSMRNKTRNLIKNGDMSILDK